jgi:hypothetical protein
MNLTKYESPLKSRSTPYPLSQRHSLEEKLTSKEQKYNNKTIKSKRNSITQGKGKIENRQLHLLAHSAEILSDNK